MDTARLLRPADKENWDLTSTVLRPKVPVRLRGSRPTVETEQLTCYAGDIELLWKNQEALMDLGNPLGRHRISPSARAKMVCWQREVLEMFDCCVGSFFLAVRVMDCYCVRTRRCLEPEELHLLGITCIFVASKFEDVCPIGMKVLQERIAHHKFTRQQIKRAEGEILATLDFRLALPTVYLFLERFLALVGRRTLQGETALALAELAMMSWKLATLPPSRLARVVQRLTRMAGSERVDTPLQGQDALALSEFTLLLEHYSQSAEGLSFSAKHPSFSMQSLLLSLT